ncbi:MAG: Gfo/Idh/MocA family oxidoreductase [Firmicutes bacterium]|nr:Gfo/Idh/MocA family oxidoreductase [Bacillota bacterium]
MNFKIGIAGLAHFHVYGFMEEALKIEGIKVVGVADENSKFREMGKERFNAAAYSNIDELLEKTDADVIVTAAVNNTKADIILKAMEAKKHVIADKPLVTTIEDLERIEEFIKNKAETKLYFMLTERYNPPLYTAKKLIEAGEIGEIVNCVSFRPHRLNPASRPDWVFNREQYGGIINDLSVHDIDVFRWFTGAEVESIIGAAHSNRRFMQFKDFEDNGEVLLKMTDGSTGFIRVDWLTPDAFPLHGDCRFFIVGTKGQIEVFTLDPKVILCTDTKAPMEVPVESRNFTMSEDFFKGIKDSSHKPVVDTIDALKSTKAALEAQKLADKMM